MSDDTRYDDYFASALLEGAAEGGPDRAAVVRDLLAHVESALAIESYPPDVREKELMLARRAAERLIAQLDDDQDRPRPLAPSAGPGARRVESIAPRWFGARAKAIAIILIAALIYALPLFLFSRESRRGAGPINAQGSAVALKLAIGVAEFAKETVTLHVEPVSGSLLKEDGRLSEDLTVKIDSGDKAVSHTFKADSHISPWTFEVYLDSGDVLDYPLDRYRVELDIDAFVKDKKVTTLEALGHVPHGVVARLDDIRDTSDKMDVAITMRRSGSIIFLAMLSTFSLLVVAIAALSVAWQVARHNRKIDFSMMTWVAAFMFVIPAVRGSLPGAPPVGALIDFLLFFWLQILAALATTILVVLWIKQRPNQTD